MFYISLPLHITCLHKRKYISDMLPLAELLLSLFRKFLGVALCEQNRWPLLDSNNAGRKLRNVVCCNGQNFKDVLQYALYIFIGVVPSTVVETSHSVNSEMYALPSMWPSSEAAIGMSHANQRIFSSLKSALSLFVPWFLCHRSIPFLCSNLLGQWLLEHS